MANLDPFKSGGGSQATKAYMDATIDIFGREHVDIMTREEVSVPEEYKDIKFIFIPQRPRFKSYLLFPFGILGRFSTSVTQIIKSNKGQYQFCIINGSLESGWCYKRLKSVPIYKVTIHHNQEVKYCMDTKNILTLRGKWPFIVKRAERNAYKFSDYNLFLTQQDMNEMRETYGQTKAKNKLIGTFDHKDAEVIRPGNEKKAFHFVASGTMAHYQTTHGIIDFYNRYYPIARRIIPGLKILLTGRDPSPEIYNLEKVTHYSIRVSGNPQNILEQVQDGKIFLCPTDIGSGLKLRGMDGLKCGLPILTHIVSASGYDYFYDKPYYRIYKDEASFEEGMKDIMTFLGVSPESAQTINKDYYDYFGYHKGVERFKRALDIP